MARAPWWKWPRNRRPNLAPWYKVLWNLIWILPILVVGYLLVFLAFCKDGWYSADRLRRDIL